MKKVLSLFICLMILLNAFPVYAIAPEVPEPIPTVTAPEPAEPKPQPTEPEPVLPETLPAEPEPELPESNEEYAEEERPTLYESYGALQDLDAIVDIAALKTVLLDAFLNCRESADISSFKIPNTDTYKNALKELIYNELPECFHFDSYSRWSNSSYITKLQPSYSIDSSTYQSMLAEIYDTRDAILEGIKGNGKLTDVQKALLIHDRLALQCQYDYHQGEHRYTLYGALGVGSCVCQGYAEAYDYLLEQVGIESYLCSSDALNHAWNIIYVGGKPYHVDVTWDDRAWDNGSRGIEGSVTHENFLRSSQGISATGHTASDYDSFPTDTTYDSYFWQSSEAAFVLLDNEIYYIDNNAQQLKRYGSNESLVSVNSLWDSSAGYWGNYSRLAADDKVLYYSLADAVYSYDPDTGTSTEVYAPTLPRYDHIYSFVCEDGKLLCEIGNAPPYAPSYRTTLYQLEYTLKPSVPEGSCGEDLRWRIEDSTLYITGTGAMADYSSSSQPWKEHQTAFTAIFVDDGVTAIGKYAFYQCSSVTDVRLPGTITRVGKYAFLGCSGLTDVSFDGRKSLWKTVTVESGNAPLTGADFTFVPALLGDVNADGSVDNLDRAVLTRYLADWDGYETIDPEAADVNQDGSVDVRDRAILTRHLAQWKDYLTLPYTA